MLVSTEAGPLEAAGKDVAGVIKSIDGKLAAVGIVAEKVKSKCKGCPSVSSSSFSHSKASHLCSYAYTVLCLLHCGSLHTYLCTTSRPQKRLQIEARAGVPQAVPRIAI